MTKPLPPPVPPSGVTFHCPLCQRTLRSDEGVFATRWSGGTSYTHWTVAGESHAVHRLESWEVAPE